MQSHWEHIYATKDHTRVSWFEPEPRHSLALVDKALAVLGKPYADVHVLDAGAGQSLFAAELVAKGCQAVTAVDISDTALQAARARVLEGHGPVCAEAVHWVVADVTCASEAAVASASVDIWHDRAVFHFMRTADEQHGYVASCARVVKPGGVAGTY